jgi:ABC-2 type transport system permease protein
VLRSLVPPLVAMLGLVLVVSPLLGGLTEQARWRPIRRAGCSTLRKPIPC